jgi:hypothetical protein
MNDPDMNGDAKRQCEHAGADDGGEQRPEPHGDEDPAPEEAGYGYGV